MYSISRIPMVLTINNMMNHASWLFLPARHNAIPFHTMDHTNRVRKAISPIVVSIKFSNGIRYAMCKLI